MASLIDLLNQQAKAVRPSGPQPPDAPEPPGPARVEDEDESPGEQRARYGGGGPGPSPGEQRARYGDGSLPEEPPASPEREEPPPPPAPGPSPGEQRARQGDVPIQQEPPGEVVRPEVGPSPGEQGAREGPGRPESAPAVSAPEDPVARFQATGEVWDKYQQRWRSTYRDDAGDLYYVPEREGIDQRAQAAGDLEAIRRQAIDQRAPFAGDRAFRNLEYQRFQATGEVWDESRQEWRRTYRDEDGNLFYRPELTGFTPEGTIDEEGPIGTGRLVIPTPDGLPYQTYEMADWQEQNLADQRGAEFARDAWLEQQGDDFGVDLLNQQAQAVASGMHQQRIDRLYRDVETAFRDAEFGSADATDPQRYTDLLLTNLRALAVSEGYKGTAYGKSVADLADTYEATLARMRAGRLGSWSVAADKVADRVEMEKAGAAYNASLAWGRVQDYIEANYATTFEERTRRGLRQGETPKPVAPYIFIPPSLQVPLVGGVPLFPASYYASEDVGLSGGGEPLLVNTHLPPELRELIADWVEAEEVAAKYDPSRRYIDRQGTLTDLTPDAVNNPVFDALDAQRSVGPIPIGSGTDYGAPGLSYFAAVAAANKDDHVTPWEQAQVNRAVVSELPWAAVAPLQVLGGAALVRGGINLARGVPRAISGAAAKGISKQGVRRGAASTAVNTGRNLAWEVPEGIGEYSFDFISGGGPNWQSEALQGGAQGVAEGILIPGRQYDVRKPYTWGVYSDPTQFATQTAGQTAGQTPVQVANIDLPRPSLQLPFVRVPVQQTAAGSYSVERPIELAPRPGLISFPSEAPGTAAEASDYHFTPIAIDTGFAGRGAEAVQPGMLTEREWVITSSGLLRPAGADYEGLLPVSQQAAVRGEALNIGTPSTQSIFEAPELRGFATLPGMFPEGEGGGGGGGGDFGGGFIPGGGSTFAADMQRKISGGQERMHPTSVAAQRLRAQGLNPYDFDTKGQPMVDAPPSRTRAMLVSGLLAGGLLGGGLMSAPAARSSRPTSAPVPTETYIPIPDESPLPASAPILSYTPDDAVELTPGGFAPPETPAVRTTLASEGRQGMQTATPADIALYADTAGQAAAVRAMVAYGLPEEEAAFVGEQVRQQVLNASPGLTIAELQQVSTAIAAAGVKAAAETAAPSPAVAVLPSTRVAPGVAIAQSTLLAPASPAVAPTPAVAPPTPGLAPTPTLTPTIAPTPVITPSPTPGGAPAPGEGIGIDTGPAPDPTPGIVTFPTPTIVEEPEPAPDPSVAYEPLPGPPTPAREPAPTPSPTPGKPSYTPSPSPSPNRDGNRPVRPNLRLKADAPGEHPKSLEWVGKNLNRVDLETGRHIIIPITDDAPRTVQIVEKGNRPLDRNLEAGSLSLRTDGDGVVVNQRQIRETKADPAGGGAGVARRQRPDLRLRRRTHRRDREDDLDTRRENLERFRLVVDRDE